MANNSGPHFDGRYSKDPAIQFEGDTWHIPAKRLHIIWGADGRFWRFIQEEPKDLKSDHAAELLQVGWLEINGTFDMSKLKVGEEYEIVYVMKFKVDAFGWNRSPVKFSVSVCNQERKEKAVLMEEYKESSTKRPQEWFKIVGGDFKVPENNNGEIEFSMYDVGSEWWKGSLVLGGVKLRPKPKQH